MTAAAGAVVMVLSLHRAGRSVPEVYLGNVWLALVFPAVGVVLLGRPGTRALAWLFSVGGLGAGAAALGFAWAAWAQAHAGLRESAGWGVWLGSWSWMLGPVAAVVVLLLLPDGRATGWRRHALVAVAAVAAARMMLVAVTNSTGTDPISGATVAVGNPLAVPALERLIWPVFGVTFGVLLVVQLATAVHLTRLYRRSAGRRRTGVAALATCAWALLLPWSDLPLAGSWVDALVLPVFALTVAFSVLHLDEGDVDLVLGRTWLWASLTTCVVAAYVLVVTVLSVTVRHAGGVSLALAASGVIALLVAPLRLRLQRSVDRTLYGARADPYASVAGLSKRLEASQSPDDVLPAVVRTITEELQLPYAAFRLSVAGGDDTVEYGRPCGDLVVLPVTYLGRTVGELVVSTPARGVALRAAEQRLLTDLARQSGVAAHGVAAAAQLRRSRERLVAAREEERRSLRRELHDDLGATLTGVALGLDAAGYQVPPGSPLVAELSQVRGVVSVAIADLRRIIEGLRPPALDEVGLAAAVRDRVLALSPGDGPEVHVVAPPLPELSPATEVAAYHVAVEAVHNAVRHADARHVTVTLGSASGSLHLLVEDDGQWSDPGNREGQGLSTMRQRVDEVGGRFDLVTGPHGTAVSAELPTVTRA